MHFIFPADPLNHRKPDETFLDQIEALTAAGFGVSYYNHDLSLIYPEPPIGSTIVYRGWMMPLGMYQRFWIVVYGRYNSNPLTLPEQYNACHHLPNWQPLIQDITPKTIVYPKDCDIVNEIRLLGWKKFFIKDFVKSLKTSVGSVGNKPEDAEVIIKEMIKYRGEIEGGICVREFEDFMPNTEERIFVLNKKAYAPSGLVPNSFYNTVEECVSKINSPFYSIDVAQRSDGVYRVVEIGDGQVSDLVGWNVDQFVSMWKKND